MLIDQIDELEIGNRAVGRKFVSGKEYFFEGHFPEHHIMPGVLIVEALAQVGAVALLSVPKYQNKFVYFAGIKSAKFRNPVVPGDTLILECSFRKLHGKIGKAYGVAKVNNIITCECLITFAIVDVQ